MDLEQTAIERLKMASDMSLRLYKQPLVITYSGGKDSDVLLHLAGKAGIPYEALHSLTTADAPETVRHVLDTFRRLELAGITCNIDTHKQPDGTNITMWNLIPRKLMPPTRLVRYCCAELKETGGRGRWIATGVRWAESQKRKSRGVMEALHKDKSKKLTLMSDNDESRMMMENCQLKGKRVINPIIDWQESDVLNYCTAEKICMNPLYACGWKRVGCIGCPMAGKHRKTEFARYPKIKAAYIRAFDRMLERRALLGKSEVGKFGATGADVFHWWMEDGVLPGQMVFEGMEDI
nr:MAG TPA: phosphoadenosine-phosphosulfate reductase [Caudoviricetes sp.]